MDIFVLKSFSGSDVLKLVGNKRPAWYPHDLRRELWYVILEKEVCYQNVNCGSFCLVRTYIEYTRG